MNTEAVCHGDTFSKRATSNVPQSNKIVTHHFRFDLIIHATAAFISDAVISDRGGL